MVLRGRLAGDPEQENGEQRFTLRVETQSSDGQAFHETKGQVRVRVLDPGFNAGWGDQVELTGRLVVPPPATVPGQYDFRARLARQGLFATLIVFQGRARVLEQASVWFPGRWVGALRRRILASFERHLSPQAAGLFAGVALGQKPAAQIALQEDFRRSGTYHLLVASGSNVAFAVGLWILVGRWVLLLPRRWVLAGAAPCAFLYAGVAGADPPVMRAAFMTAVGVLAYLLAREDKIEHAVAFSAGALLLFKPQSLFDASFQMSYAAVLGVVLGVPALDPWARRTGPFRWPLRLFFTSLSAQAALTPLLLHYFHRFSWAGLVANMLAVPLAALSLAVGAGLALLDNLAPALAPWAGRCAEALAQALAAWAHASARLPGAEIRTPWNGAQTFWLALAMAGTFLLLGGRSPSVLDEKGRSTETRRAKPWAWLFLLWLLAVPAVYIAGRSNGPPGLTVTWLDVGLGDAVVVKTPAGRVTVVDGGNSQGGQRLVSYLLATGISRVDRVILTSADPGHAEGILRLLSEAPVGEFICSSATWNDGLWSAGRALVDRRKIPRRMVSRGDSWTEEGVSWTVLSAPAEAGGNAALEVRLGDQSVLLASDMSVREQIRLRSGEWTVIQWPHHGNVPADPDFLGRSRWRVVSGPVPGDGTAFSTGRQGTIQWWTDGTRSAISPSDPPPK